MTMPGCQRVLGRKIAAERRRLGLSQPELVRNDRPLGGLGITGRSRRPQRRSDVGAGTLAAALDIPFAELAAEAPDACVHISFLRSVRRTASPGRRTGGAFLAGGGATFCLLAAYLYAKGGA